MVWAGFSQYLLTLSRSRNSRAALRRHNMDLRLAVVSCVVSPKRFLSHPDCVWRMARLGVEQHAADAVLDHSITAVITAGSTQTVFFFFVSLFLSSTMSANPSRHYDWVHGGPLFAGHIPSAPAFHPTNLWRCKELLHKTAIGQG